MHTTTFGIHELEEHKPDNVQAVMNAKERLVAYSPSLREKLVPLREFLFKNVYWHPDVNNANEEAVEMMRKLFMYYVDHPESMGRKARARLEKGGVWRTACDYVSGMTDRYALEEVQKFKV